MKGGDNMKKIWTKVPSMIGMVLTLFAVFSLVEMFIYILFPNLLYDGTSFYDSEVNAWQCSISVIIFSAFSMVFYAIDAILSTIKAIMKIDKKFNIVLSFVIIVGVLIGGWIITSYLRTYKNIIWFSYYFFVLFVFEIISIIRCVKQRPKRTSLIEN